MSFETLKAAYEAAEQALADAQDAREMLTEDDVAVPGVGERADARVEDAERAVADALAALRAMPAADVLAHLGVEGKVEPHPENYEFGEAEPVVAVVSVAGWYADGGDAEIHYPDARSASEARRAYVDSANWGVVDETTWVGVRAWRRLVALLADGAVVTDDDSLDDGFGRVAIEPEEPPCADGHDHDFRSPHWLVGGCDSNPGVWGHGGGVIMRAGCRHCGCGCVVDTWAQDPEDGTQGLTSTRYEPGEYAAEFLARGASAAEDVDLSDEGVDLSDRGALYREGYAEELRRRGALDVEVSDNGCVNWRMREEEEEEEEEAA